MDSDSEDERQRGYQPVLAEKMGRQNSNALPRPESARHWLTGDGASVYTNELFHDDEEGTGGPNGIASPSSQAPGAAASRKGPSLAAKRQQRLESGAYAPNSLLKSPSQRAPAAPGSPRGETSGVASPYRPATLPTPIAGTQSSNGGAQPGMVHGLRASYDPNEGEEGYVMNVTARPMQQQQASQQQYAALPRPPALDLSDLRSFLMAPGPKNGPVMCYIVRDKGGAKMYPRYMLFLEDGKRFMLAARKRKKQTTSNYIVSLDMDDMGRDSDNFFGKVRANFVGTEFTIYDNGEKSARHAGPNGARVELGAVTYQYNVLGTRGPRKMMASIPAVDGGGNSVFRPVNAEDSILDRVRARRALDELVVMGNKPPRWNDELNAYCLNFNGRVTEASVKNFQLVSDDNHNHVILQFGKVGKNTFTMDYQWPISAFQAFSICISSFDNKLACE